mmetsp:Transcript_15492/g.25844  ORF Transcript_15492/g.25844 Transcript_15492/m.25844 type:complete len:162 (+) Transcript_15492:147-632(+)|eukprot:CAMPEP_0119012120 /NCGR_PEP_ID=MMETSP1176-20130426/6092_1 /TAXON_ID=265551 /ORGANISM="Synedropsis recta cf, Strain CCMP1620" /LENGTH=161 /DNA_ID=CAMNT_0006965029 /DNA_START=115 /DNA_END=600 /DNA_ORIENTATION=-
MVESNKFAHAQFLGPASYQPEPEIIVINGAPAFASGSQNSTAVIAHSVASPIAVSPPKLTNGYTTTRKSYTIPAHQHQQLDRARMKKTRKRRKVMAGVVGGTVGLIALGPLGAIGFGAGSALVVKYTDRSREKRFLQRLDDQSLQQQSTTVTMPIHAAQLT